MPRTKVARKGLQKRNRRSSVEEREMKLRDFDAMVENHLSSMEDDYNETMQKISEEMNKLRSKISARVLNMTMGELRERNDIRSIFDLTVISSKDLNSTAVTDVSTIASLSMVTDKLRQKDFGDKKRSHDDGYNTAGSSARSSGVGSFKSSQSSLQSSRSNTRFVGPLASAKARERRSKSSGPAATPLKSSVLGNSKSQMSVHASRSKYKTPMGSRAMTASADRYLITPKVSPNHPLAILRRANVGETCFSAGGSPVISNSAVEEVANVNIPVPNGVISIRPTQLSYRDTDVVQTLDVATIAQLRVLQQNLNRLMEAAEKKNYSVKHK